MDTTNFKNMRVGENEWEWEKWMRVGEMNEGGRKWMRKRERMRKEWKGDEWDNSVQYTQLLSRTEQTVLKTI